MRIIRIINKGGALSLTFLLFPFTLPMMGQDDLKKDLQETIQKNVLLEKDIESLITELDKVKKQKKDILDQIGQDSIKNKEFENTYNSLIESTNLDSVNSLRLSIDSLESKHQSLQASTTSIKKEISKRKKELENANSDLQNMNVYSKIQKEQLYKDNKQYLTQKYAHMSLKKLDELLKSIDDYKIFDDFSDYQKRCLAAKNNKLIFDEAWKCINDGSGYQNIGELRKKIFKLLDIKNDDAPKGLYKLSPGQFNEMDSLDISLSRFNNGIKELQNIVSSINTDEEIINLRVARKAGSKNECISLIKEHIFYKSGSDQETVHQRYFKMIPYLEKLLRKYWDELEANPFKTPTKTEIIINDLVVK